MIAAGGLAGKVTSVTGGTAEVTLITDASSAVSAQVDARRRRAAIVKPEVGEPDDLLLDFIEKGRRVDRGHHGGHVRLHVLARGSSRCSRAASRSAA